jgi:hypothetical protein
MYSLLFSLVVLVPAVWSSIQLFASSTTYQAWDLFERSHPSTVIQLPIVPITLQGDCQLPTLTEPCLLLINYTQLYTANCISTVHVLEIADALGYSSKTLIGIYGHDADLYDTAGPLVPGAWSLDERPTTVQAIAIDPAFVTAFLKQQGNGTALVTSEPGAYNLLASSTACIALWYVVLAHLIAAFVYGLYHSFWHLLVHFYRSWTRQPKTPLTKFSISCVIRLASLYCLLSWIISWRYRNTPIKMFWYYSSLFSAISGFCLMVYRWCDIAQKIRGHALYRIVRVWSLAEIGIACVATFGYAAMPLFGYSTAYVRFAQAVYSYLLLPTLTWLCLTFVVSSVVFLRQVKHIQLPSPVVYSLSKITVIGLCNFIIVAYYLVSTVIDQTGVGNGQARYMTLLVLESFLWVVYHTLIFYLLSIPLPKKQPEPEPPMESPLTYRGTIPERYARPSSEIWREERDASKWNDIMLHGFSTKYDRKRAYASPRVPPRQAPSSSHSNTAQHGMGGQVHILWPSFSESNIMPYGQSPMSTSPVSRSELLGSYRDRLNYLGDGEFGQ